MKILYIITQADGGGAQRYVLSLAQHFGGSIAAGSEDSALFEQANKLGIQTYPLKHLKRDINLWHDFLALFEIWALVKMLKPDIVHLNSTKAGFLGSFAGKMAGAKVVFTAHGFRFLEPLPVRSQNFYLGLDKLARPYRDRIIAVSEKDRTAALGNKIIPADQITTVHNGIPQINFLPRGEARSALALPSDKFIFGTVANFYKTKGLDILVDAVAMLKGELMDKCLFALIGDGSQIEDLRLKVEDLKLQSYIRLLGKIESANIYLKAFDAYILPSRKEGFPFALLDALQAGLPIIATNVGGNDEAIGYAGLLVEPNAKSIATAITEMITDQSKLSQLSAKALERSTLFTEEKMLGETKQVYEKVLRE